MAPFCLASRSGSPLRKYMSLLNLPIRGCRSWEAHDGNRQPVHQPHRYRPTRAIAPNDIGLAIPVHIPRLCHLPDGWHPARKTGGGNDSPIHQPDRGTAISRVAPDQVGFPIAVYIAHPRNLKSY